MINKNKVLAIIPARGGSKGLPGKNIIDVDGEPLLFYTFEQAKKSKYIDRIILSSEDEEIIKIAKVMGFEVPFKRPKNLALDTSGTMPVIFHALDMLSQTYDYIVLLQVTSPLRLHHDIDKSIELCEEKNASACVSVVEVNKPLDWTFSLSKDNKLKSIVGDLKIPIRRQDAPKHYSVNGAVYVAKVEWLKLKEHFLTDETIVHIMPKSRSIDIDSEEDLILLDHFISKSKK
jgi:CMP-N,N'-diacetyllegionaminic acid synthase